MYDDYLNNNDIDEMKHYQNIVIDKINEEVLRVVEIIPIDGKKVFTGAAKFIGMK